MNDDLRQFESFGDPLDDWLAQAEFATPDAASTNRLRTAWRGIWKVQSRSHRQYWIGGAIAAVLCVAVIGWKLIQPAPRLQEAAYVEPKVVLPTYDSTPPTSARRVVSRAPTPLELKMLAAAERIEKRSLAAAKVTVNASEKSDSTAPRDEQPRQQIAVIARNSSATESARVDAMATLLRRADDRSMVMYLSFAADPATRQLAFRAADLLQRPPTDALLEKLNDSRVATRMAAAAVLGHIDGPETTRKLAALVVNNVNRREALYALAASNGPEAKAFLERAARTNELSAAVASTMIQTAYQ